MKIQEFNLVMNELSMTVNGQYNLAVIVVQFDTNDRPVRLNFAQATVHFKERPFCSLLTVYFKERPFWSLLTVHFDSFFS